jgi:hypothetical protein
VDALTGVFSWTPTEVQGPGSYQVRMIVTDNGLPPLSATNEFTVTVAQVNVPPSVRLTSPADGLTLPAPATVRLVAMAHDPDGTVVRVEFFQGTDKVGETSLVPHQLEVSGLVAGAYLFSARAMDDQDGVSTSNTVSVTVALAFIDVTLLPDGTVQLDLVGEPGATYEVQGSGDLLEWLRLGEATAGSSGEITFADPPETFTKTKFYRLLKR